MDQYIMWKLMKVMGKTILEYLSMSLARIPMIRSGGALKNYVRKSLQTKVFDNYAANTGQANNNAIGGFRPEQPSSRPRGQFTRPIACAKPAKTFDIGQGMPAARSKLVGPGEEMFQPCSQQERRNRMGKFGILSKSFEEEIVWKRF